ncbi:MAG: PGPGW domain-containing protein [Planctomycetaceae bacterium]
MNASPDGHRLGHHRDVWGDEPEEVEASEVVAEFSTDVEVQRAWHEHPAFTPFKVVWAFIRRSGKRIAVTIVGFAVLIAGVALLVLPGPGWLLIFIGLGILGTEYVWAQRLLRIAKEKAGQAKDAVLGNNRKKPGETDPA